MISQYFDSYTIRARLTPCLVATLPLAAAVLPYYDKSYGWGFFSLLFIQISIAILVAQFSRDAGKQIQNELFTDKMPHICFLRFRDPQYSFEKKQKLHEILSYCCHSVQISEETEKSDPKQADNVYSLWCDWLKQHVRKKESFYLVQEENINYGFRRNLYGLKRVWLLSLLLGILIFIINLFANSIIRAENITTFILILCSIFSYFRVTKEWTVMAANEYASQLHLAALSINIAEKAK
ncbi:hypothetical protein LJB81_03080 [Desulfovibrio sp. OttesenSCG-928-M14]|nr:hypothetical protein [Desulfovibrio sp. OttesenSCG-928-M14]